MLLLCVFGHNTIAILSLVRMKVLAIVWLLTTLVGDSFQECTIEQFEMAANELVTDSESTETSVNVTIKEIYYNCLSTSEKIGNYFTMSVSLIYNISSDPDEGEIQYNMLCVNGEWGRVDVTSTALRSNVTRIDCYLCLNTTVNEDHCSREYI